MDKRREAIGRIVAQERGHRRAQLRAALILSVTIVLGLGVLAYALKEVARSQPAPAATVDLSKLPPIRPGPER